MSVRLLLICSWFAVAAFGQRGPAVTRRADIRGGGGDGKCTLEVEVDSVAVAAAAVGLILATTVQLGRKSLNGLYDLVFIVLAVIGVNRFHLSVPYVLLGVGALAIFWYRPRRAGTLEGGR